MTELIDRFEGRFEFERTHAVVYPTHYTNEPHFPHASARQARVREEQPANQRRDFGPYH